MHTLIIFDKAKCYTCFICCKHVYKDKKFIICKSISLIIVQKVNLECDFKEKMHEIKS